MVDVTLLDVDSGDTLERAIADLSEAESLYTVMETAWFDRIRNDQPGKTIAIRIPASDATTVLVAVYYDIEEVDEKHINLFEILAAYVSTALSTVDTDRLNPEFMNTI